MWIPRVIPMASHSRTLFIENPSPKGQPQSDIFLKDKFKKLNLTITLLYVSTHFY